MLRKNCLMLNFAIVGLITIVLIRDRAINEMFQISIDRQDQPAIVIPGYRASCQEGDTLYCRVDLAHFPLIIESPSNSNCKATYGRQVISCYRVQASALDTLYVENLQLSPQQQALIELQMRIKPIASLRLLEDGIENGVFLLAMLTILSILSGINVAEALYSYCYQSYPRNRFLQVLAVVIGRIIVPLLLSFYFFILLMTFGYTVL
jgi:hypothetical protein